MINLEQIQKLEARVTKAVELIKTLKTENHSLRQTLDSAQNRMQELESLVKDFKTDQKDIERSILRALENLNELEDEINDTEATAVSPEPGEESKEVPEEAEESLPFEAKEAAEDSPGSGELDIF
ncbi:MAG: cell division protein ZapB [Spirochaetaceae bacterium]|nr:MAG: cell division protein ZapB [Spirochaetaceae bacterium]